MDFTPTDEQRAARDLAARIFGDLSTHDRPAVAGTGAGTDMDGELWKALCAAGLVGAVGEIGLLGLVLLLEEQGRTTAQVPFAATCVYGMLAVAALGTEEQRARLLPAIGDGTVVVTGAFPATGRIRADVSLAPFASPAALGGGALSGTAAVVPWLRDATHVLVPDADRELWLVATAGAGVTVEAVETTAPWSAGRLTLKGALGERVGGGGGGGAGVGDHAGAGGVLRSFSPPAPPRCDILRLRRLGGSAPDPGPQTPDGLDSSARRASVSSRLRTSDVSAGPPAGREGAPGGSAGAPDGMGGSPGGFAGKPGGLGGGPEASAGLPDRLGGSPGGPAGTPDGMGGTPGGFAGNPAWLGGAPEGSDGTPDRLGVAPGAAAGAPDGTGGALGWSAVVADGIGGASGWSAPVPDGAVGFARPYDLVLGASRIAFAGLQSGVCAGSLARAVAHTSEREQFGRPLAANQGVLLRAADAYMDTEAIRVTAYEAAWRHDEGLPFATHALTAAWWASEAGQRVVHAGQHLHGGAGADLEHPVHRHFLWGRQLDSYLGCGSEVLEELGQLLSQSQSQGEGEEEGEAV